MIHFYVDMIYKAEKYIHDSHELLDIKQDIDKIDFAMRNIQTLEGIRYANELDRELRRKYPTINLMLNIANCLPKTLENRKGISKTESIPESDALWQDRCGIICHVLLKKNVVSSLEQCICKVTEESIHG